MLNVGQYTFPIVSSQGVTASLLKRQSRGSRLQNGKVRDVEFLRTNTDRVINHQAYGSRLPSLYTPRIWANKYIEVRMLARILPVLLFSELII